MIDQKDIARKVASLETLLAKKFSATDGTLERRLQKVGRRLPARIRNDIQTVAETAHLTGNLKIANQVDPKQTEAAYERAKAHLEAVDVADRRKGAVLSVLGSVAFNLITVSVILIVVLVWRGFV